MPRAAGLFKPPSDMKLRVDILKAASARYFKYAQLQIGGPQAEMIWPAWMHGDLNYVECSIAGELLIF